MGRGFLLNRLCEGEVQCPSSEGSVLSRRVVKWFLIVDLEDKRPLGTSTVRDSAMRSTRNADVMEKITGVIHIGSTVPPESTRSTSQLGGK